MIIYNNSNNQVKKQVPKTEEESKSEMLEELRKESLSIICLACLYAKKFEETGMDITERWATTEQQSEIIQNFYYQGYKKGYMDGIEKGKEIEREEMAQMQTGLYGLNEEYFDATGMTVGKDAIKNVDVSRINFHSKRKSPTKKKKRR